MRIVKYVSCLSIVTLLFALCARAQPNMSKLNENTIYVGPAVIRCCKHIDLYRVGGSHTEKTLTINHSSKNFGRAQKWIFYNLFDALNRQRQP
ncbi:MAG: hypothetical protein K8F91_01655, partial [Candidatus Obscuribacterales bacterium]|nr:hypothetical protein [Candidatus Obscuribacterales bacterium]